MLRFVLFLCLFLYSNLEAEQKHPINNISLTEIEYKPELQRLEIAIKVYTEDILLAFGEHHGRIIEIGTDREEPNAEEILFAYLEQHLKIQTLDAKEIKYTYLGRELERSDYFAIWVFAQAENIPPCKGMKITNSILSDYIPHQNNILNFKYKETVKNFNLGEDELEAVVTW